MFNMGEELAAGFARNKTIFNDTMEKIFRKYTYLSHIADANIDFDLNDTSDEVLCGHFRQVQDQLEMSFADWESTRVQEGDESVFNSNHSVHHEGASGLNDTQMSRSFWDETLRGQLPEDQDEELEKTLSSRGGAASFAELYPSMLEKVSKAVHGQQVSDAADSVLRKYRRQRCAANASLLADRTLDVSARAAARDIVQDPKKEKKKKRTTNNASLLDDSTLDVSARAAARDIVRDPRKKKTTNKGKVIRRRSPNLSSLANLTPEEATKAVDQSPSPLDVAGNQQEHGRPILFSPAFIAKLHGGDAGCSFSSPVKRSPFIWPRDSETQSSTSRGLPQSPAGSGHTARGHSAHPGETTSRSASPYASPQKYSKHPAGESRSRSASPLSSPEKDSRHPGRCGHASQPSSPQRYSRAASTRSSTAAEGSVPCSDFIQRTPFNIWLKNVESRMSPRGGCSQSPKTDLMGGYPHYHHRHPGESRARSASPFASPQKYSKHPAAESRSRSASPLPSPQKSIASPQKNQRCYSHLQPVNSCQSPSRIHNTSDTAWRQSHCGRPAFTRSRSETPRSPSVQASVRVMSPSKRQRCSDSPSRIPANPGTGHSSDISTWYHHHHHHHSNNSSSIRHSPKKIDTEYQRVYHIFVCQGKPFSSGPPCGMCATRLDDDRAVRALALSPHRAHLGKRRRHEELDSSDGSSHANKRFRGPRHDDDVANSPGSLRYLKDRLKPSSGRRLLYPTGPASAHDRAECASPRPLKENLKPSGSRRLLYPTGPVSLHDRAECASPRPLEEDPKPSGSRRLLYPTGAEANYSTDSDSD